MKLHRLSLVLTVCSLLSAPLYAEQQPVRILASLPITYSLGASLLEGTAVQLQRAAPANLPASRQSAYFSGRGASALDKVARDADAVISLRSLWPDDPLYPLARRSNIRIVEVDGARPVDGALPGIALQNDGRDILANRPWLNINNLGRMADVIAADLVRLSPSDTSRIEANLAGFKQRLLSLSAKSESRLVELSNLSVISLSPSFVYLLASLNLDAVEPPDTEPAGEWTQESLEQLKRVIRDNDVHLVLSDRPADDTLAAAIKDAGGQLLVPKSESEDAVVVLEEVVEQVINALSHL